MADYFDQYFEKMNTMNKESAKAQMDFQERMSSSAHVREVQDLIKAGLNPVLSANNGASSPMGAYANVDNSAVSAKFARYNLERELSNQRTIAAMNNENAMKIALAQIAGNYKLGVYQSDNAYKASVYGSDISKAIAQMQIDNPTSIPGIVAKLIGEFMGNDSVAETGKTFGDKGLFGTIYDLAKRYYDRDNGFSFSAKRVQDIQNRVNKEKAIIAGAKKASNEAYRSGATKQEARKIYSDYLRNHKYYQLVGKNIFNTII